MPGRDRTGPLGNGSRSGRGLGICNGYQVSGDSYGVGGRGFRNTGRGLRRFPSENLKSEGLQDTQQNDSVLDYLSEIIDDLRTRSKNK